MRISSNIINVLFLSACTLLCACRENVISEPADFVFSTENIEGDEAYYSKPAVITGHIANRDVYPNVIEIGITIPFYDRVDNRQTSLIYKALSLVSHIVFCCFAILYDFRFFLH